MMSTAQGFTNTMEQGMEPMVVTSPKNILISEYEYLQGIVL
ncbi:hypothetical protein AF70_00041070 [Pseudomonas sp. KD5]|jgi:hypothetical protein|uniref:Uncharacterized protein n=1 Tax=Pseudomonas umsongensis TaxID=198618 RepID=A0ACC5MER1_9PSED|nr:hypothetical protein [Pseudomonas umsongensis]NMN78529.1 hypothetical protein [Pseudomonas sp. KD5]CAH0172084.1 hypothetical protein SRABI123_01220 [Pseudomonas sp. Bi123]